MLLYLLLLLLIQNQTIDCAHQTIAQVAKSGSEMVRQLSNSGPQIAQMIKSGPQIGQIAQIGQIGQIAQIAKSGPQIAQVVTKQIISDTAINLAGNIVSGGVVLYDGYDVYKKEGMVQASTEMLVSSSRLASCGYLGYGVTIVTGGNPIVGGVTTVACNLLTPYFWNRNSIQSLIRPHPILPAEPRKLIPLISSKIRQMLCSSCKDYRPVLNMQKVCGCIINDKNTTYGPVTEIFVTYVDQDKRKSLYSNNREAFVFSINEDITPVINANSQYYFVFFSETNNNDLDKIKIIKIGYSPNNEDFIFKISEDRRNSEVVVWNHQTLSINPGFNELELEINLNNFNSMVR